MMAVPELRFSEFDREWEDTPMRSLMSERNDQAPQSDEYPLMAFIANKGVAPKGDRYNRDFLVKDEQGKKYKKTEMGDFIYSSNNLEAGSIGMNSFGPASISPVYSIFKINKKCNHKFISEFLSRPEFVAKMVRFRQGVVYGQWRIHEKAFLGIAAPVPTLPEQQKIAAFLGAVDDKIDALRRKHESLKQYKVGLMQKLFSQELRFKRDDGSDFPDWEEKRLSDLAFRPKTKNDGIEISRVLTNSAVSGVVDQGEYFDKDIANAESLAGYYVVEAGDFVYNPRISSSAPVGPLHRNDLGRGVMSPLYTVFRFEAEDTDFYRHYFHNHSWHPYMKSVANYGARHDRMAITNADFMAMPLPVPHEDEKQKIADCLSAVDSKIEAVDGQIAQMEAFKKGLLQKMFV